MFRNKPVIAVSPLVDKERNSYWMLPGYMKGIEAQGAIPVMPSLSADPDALDLLLERCDGFLLAGGQDVGPSLYGEEKRPCCGETLKERDVMDRNILLRAVAADKPVLGICRGLQLINAAFGGTLHQNLPTERPSLVQHKMEPPYDRAAHMISLLPDTPLRRLLQTNECAVNSCHHQGVKELARGLQVMAKASDGLVEALRMPDRLFVWGVQWHPEFSFQADERAARIFAAFVDAARRRAKPC